MQRERRLVDFTECRCNQAEQASAEREPGGEASGWRCTRWARDMNAGYAPLRLPRALAHLVAGANALAFILTETNNNRKTIRNFESKTV